MLHDVGQGRLGELMICIRLAHYLIRDLPMDRSSLGFFRES